MQTWNLVRNGIVIFSLYFPGFLSAGQLDDFEAEATETRTSSREQTSRTESTSDNHRDRDGRFLDLVFDVLDAILSPGAELSSARINGTTDPRLRNIERREIGSPDLPFIRLDLNYQDTTSDIHALDGRVELGYGPFGLEYRKTFFKEDTPNDELDIKYFRGLYRVSGSSKFEINAGLGLIEIEGDSKSSGLSTSLPMNYYPHPYFGIRLVPSWSWINGNPINDFEGSLAYIRKYISVRAGYRRISSSSESLQGPYVGISLHY